MMSLPRHNHGQGYNLLASAAIQDLRADNVPCLAWQLASFMVRKCNRKALF